MLIVNIFMSSEIPVQPIELEQQINLDDLLCLVFQKENLNRENLEQLKKNVKDQKDDKDIDMTLGTIRTFLRSNSSLSDNKYSIKTLALYFLSPDTLKNIAQRKTATIPQGLNFLFSRNDLEGLTGFILGKLSTEVNSTQEQTNQPPEIQQQATPTITKEIPIVTKPNDADWEISPEEKEKQEESNLLFSFPERRKWLDLKEQLFVNHVPIETRTKLWKLMESHEFVIIPNSWENKGQEHKQKSQECVNGIQRSDWFNALTDEQKKPIYNSLIKPFLKETDQISEYDEEYVSELRDALEKTGVNYKPMVEQCNEFISGEIGIRDLMQWATENKVIAFRFGGQKTGSFTDSTLNITEFNPSGSEIMDYIGIYTSNNKLILVPTSTSVGLLYQNAVAMFRSNTARKTPNYFELKEIILPAILQKTDDPNMYKISNRGGN